MMDLFMPAVSEKYLVVYACYRCATSRVICEFSCAVIYLLLL